MTFERPVYDRKRSKLFDDVIAATLLLLTAARFRKLRMRLSDGERAG